MSITTSANSQGPTSSTVGNNTSVSNQFSFSVTNTTSSTVTISTKVRVEIDGKPFSNEKTQTNVSLSPGQSLSDNGTVFLNFAPTGSGTHQVKSTTRVDDGGALGGPKQSVSTNWSFPVSS
ncbi:hypothetical protein [Yoonia sediminilitoris]|uniref:hypothetical protein n=1 Tax=Yoonia sediminilitoris TaxID=1286148 RepID=UPI00105730DF|nr:hypothetical protein [Yoonia sediminilitoris]